MRRRRRHFRACLGFLLALLPSVALADEVFDISTIPSTGRAVAAELVDLNGDGRTDLLQVVFRSLPPNEQRVVRVHLQAGEGSIPADPTFEVQLPPGSAAYDLADVRDAPGVEMVILRQSDLVILSLGNVGGTLWTLPIPGVGSIGPDEDERGLERLPIAFEDFGPEVWLLVRQLGRLVALSPSGDVLADFDTGGRANYLVPAQPGLFFIESDMQLFYDTPRLSVGDVDGDGAADIVTAMRHYVRVYLRRPDGSFGDNADRVIAVGRMKLQDHVRGSGGVSMQARDMNGDGVADLLVSYLRGGISEAHKETSAYMNRGGTWNLNEADRTLESDEALGSDTLIDMDGDGRPELVRVSIPFSLLEVVEALMTRSFDAKVAIYKPDATGIFAAKPWVDLKLDVAFSFDTFRTKGFLPNWNADLNHDGYLDLLTSGDGDEVEVFLGGPERRYQKRDARQNVDSGGQVRFGDLDGDGLQDLVIFDPSRNDVPVRILRNRGMLPGSPPKLRAPKTPTAP
jgi:hypothetical protein